MPASTDLQQMEHILEEMLQSDESITARAVARRHPLIRHASSITRHSVRSELVAKYQARQTELRSWRARLQKGSTEKIAAGLAQKDQRIAELERKVEALKIAMLAMIRSVGALGGVSRWLSFFDDYRQIPEELKRLGLIPETKVKQIGASGE
jgi:hypothetical protein